MTARRRDGLYLLLLGSAVFLLLGGVLERTAPVEMVDFRMMYYPARCLIQHCDPYNEQEVLRVYRAEGGEQRSNAERVRQVVTRYVYPPTAFSLTVPIALLPWGPAHWLWMTLTVGSMVFASVLVWSLGADYAPILSGALVGFLLASSETLVITGTVAGLAISLCVVAVWCFIRERYVLAGILCLAMSLAIKPQDAGLVWLYYLLAGGVYRKRALQTLFATLALSLPVLLWVWCVAPHWIYEMHGNLSTFFIRGGINDPGPASTGGRGIATVVSLQSVISVFRDDPRIYNPASYLVCAVLLLVWAYFTLRARPSLPRAYLALAAISALTMLPVYHRQYDAKLLLLTVPACAMLWAKGGLTGRLVLLVNTAGFVLTGDLFCTFFLGVTNNLHLPPTRLTWEVLMVAQVFPAPVILLVMGVFYLWAYVRCSLAESDRNR